MKKIIVVIAGIIILGAGIYWLSNNVNLFYTPCLHREGSATWYFDKKFISKPETEIFTRAIAISDSGCKDIYKIKDGDSLREVSKIEFQDFLKKFNSNCNDCLAYTSRGFIPNRGYYDYKTHQLISDFNITQENTGN